MMGQALEPQALDESRTHTLVLSGGEGSSLAGHFTGSETLAATLWPGSSYAVSATLSAAWDGSVSGNPALIDNPVVTLTISKSALSGLASGTYQVQVIADPGSVDELLFEGPIRLEPARGSTVVPTTYCSYEDMVNVYPDLPLVEALIESRAAQFLPERSAARKWIDDTAMARARAALLSQQWMSGGSCFANAGGLAPASSTLTLDQGAYFGASVFPDTTLEADLATIRSALDADQLLTDANPSSREVRRIAASYALFLALRWLPGEMRGGLTYKDLSAEFYKDAKKLLFATKLGIDTDDDGVADYLLSS